MRQWIGLESRGFQALQPFLNDFQNLCHIQFFMNRRILVQIQRRQFEQGSRRAEAVFLEVDERAGQLDQPLVKRAVRIRPPGQP